MAGKEDSMMMWMFQRSTRLRLAGLGALFLMIGIGGSRDAFAAETQAPAVALGPTFAPRPDRVQSASASGIWISRSEIQALPTSGRAWSALLARANAPAGVPVLSDQDQSNNVNVLAKALVYARTGTESYRTEVRQNCVAAINTELGGRTLALGRELEAYVIAADLVGLEPEEDALFREWLRRCLTEVLDGKTLVETHEGRPNNWGTHAGSSRAAVAAYLGDAAELARTAKVFKGWLGDRSSYAGFKYGDRSWQADSTRPVGVNPRGAVKNGESIDGVMPDDMRRGCSFQFPPCQTNYPWGALQGAVTQAEILYRQGYDTWNWSDQALKRAVQFLYDLNARYPGNGWWAQGDDEWILWIVNRRYGTHFPAALPANPGKNMGWTDWTHAAVDSPDPPPQGPDTTPPAAITTLTVGP